jgi:hypothetical protein
MSPDTATKKRWMLKTRKGKVSWPRLAMPGTSQSDELAQKTSPEATRNSWVEPTPVPTKPSPLKPLTDGAQKVSSGTKAAWQKTVDALTPGPATTPTPSNSSRIAKRAPEPSVWKRMFGAKQELQQPQTVPEWMAQRRVEP